MSSRQWIFRLDDILQAINRIEGYLHEFDKAQFEADQRTIDATIRNLEIIGEAACRIPDEITQQYPQIPWRYMRDMRNFLIHEYFGVHTGVIWETLVHDLPPLKSQLKSLKEDVQKMEPLF